MQDRQAARDPDHIPPPTPARSPRFYSLGGDFMGGVRVLCLAAILAASAHASAHLASAQDNEPPPVVDGWGLRIDPELSDSGYLERSLNPGDTLTGSLYLVNALEESKTLEVLKVVGINGQGGGLSLGDPGAGFVDWIDFNRARYDMPPESHEVIEFTLTIPPDAAPFEYVGGFVAQIPDDLLPVTEGGLGIVIRQRVGVSLIITVGEPSTCALTLTDFDAAYRESGEYVAIARLMVAGDVHFRGVGHVDMRRPGAPNPVASWDLDIPYSAAGLPLVLPLTPGEPIQPGRYNLSASIQSSEVESCGLTIEQEILITPAEYEQAEQRRAEIVAASNPVNPGGGLRAILATDENGDLVFNLPPDVGLKAVGVLGAAGTVTALVGGAILWAVRPSRRRKKPYRR